MTASVHPRSLSTAPVARLSKNLWKRQGDSCNPLLELDGSYDEAVQHADILESLGLTSDEIALVRLARQIQNGDDRRYTRLSYDALEKQLAASVEDGNDRSPAQSVPAEHVPQNTDGAAPQTEQFGFFEALDEQQIVDELQGRVLEQYFYEIQIGGRTVTGISYAGVKAAAKWLSANNRRSGLGGIEVMPDYELRETPDSYILTVRARDNGSGLIMPGLSTQAKKMRLKTGEIREDQFSLQKAYSKAVRNALRNLIPEKVILEMFKEWKEGGRKQ